MNHAVEPETPKVNAWTIGATLELQHNTSKDDGNFIFIPLLVTETNSENPSEYWSLEDESLTSTNDGHSGCYAAPFGSSAVGRCNCLIYQVIAQLFLVVAKKSGWLDDLYKSLKWFTCDFPCPSIQSPTQPSNHPSISDDFRRCWPPLTSFAVCWVKMQLRCCNVGLRLVRTSLHQGDQLPCMAPWPMMEQMVFLGFSVIKGIWADIAW